MVAKFAHSPPDLHLAMAQSLSKISAALHQLGRIMGKDTFEVGAAELFCSASLSWHVSV